MAKKAGDDPGDTAVSVYFEVHVDHDFNKSTELGAFTSCEGLGCEVVIEQREEGGMNSFVHQLPGRIKYTNIKLTRPVNADTAKIASWFAKMDGTVKRTSAQIIAKNHLNEEVHTWTLVGVIPVRWQGPSLSVESAKVATETLELAHHGFLAEGDMKMAPTTAGLKKAQLDLREPVKDGKRFKEGASLGVLEFTFNPKDYSMALQAGWNFKATKKPGAYPEFTGTQLRTLDFEMFLDETHKDDGDVSKAVKTLLQTVRPTDKSKSSGAPFPPIVRFSWGSSEPFVGVVKSISANFTLFRLSGLPVRAVCKVSMQEYAADPERQNPTSGSLRSARSHRVTLGDSLASIANTEYGAPTLWRGIAMLNGIDDPFDLRIGRELLIPSPAEAAELA